VTVLDRADAALFDMLGDALTAPAIHSTIGEDEPRARATDPVQSHRAADRSARSRDAVFGEVLRLVHAHGPMTGVELNDLYRGHHPGPGDPLRVAYDSPRKRAAELADRGLLSRVGEGDSAGHADVYLYLLTPEGLASLSVGAAS
jgi:hypothetical protein